MKVVFASTQQQIEKIKELADYMYSFIFPFYYADDDIDNFKKIKVLQTSKHHFEYFSTLKEAYQVIASLQTIISILEYKLNHPMDTKYEEIFNHNVAVLEEYDIFFPFYYSQFIVDVNGKVTLSIYKKAANELLI
ncbi:DUF5365 family protein [Bacillus sp. FJAT-49736]|uniref:DUF5365 family protein n=1 Tax=Bacillus sp. FJAT-49736 TaxID=2833582 RepID=UPI001BCA4E60|nr:DUF5365 family protein [Bacillus sp. FJAT-49736]MBS4171803.1 YhcU family protein [Bacillus sp. FJAT-49736]